MLSLKDHIKRLEWINDLISVIEFRRKIMLNFIIGEDDKSDERKRL